MQSMSTQWDSRYEFWSLNTKQMNWVQNIQIEMRKYEDIKSLEIQPVKVSTCSFCFYLVNFKQLQTSSIQLVGKMTLLWDNVCFRDFPWERLKTSSKVKFRKSHPELFYEKDVYVYEKSQENNCAGFFFK